jgi:hypothetical protein
MWTGMIWLTLLRFPVVHGRPRIDRFQPLAFDPFDLVRLAFIILRFSNLSGITRLITTHLFHVCEKIHRQHSFPSSSECLFPDWVLTFDSVAWSSRPKIPRQMKTPVLSKSVVSIRHFNDGGTGQSWEHSAWRTVHLFHAGVMEDISHRD